MEETQQVNNSIANSIPSLWGIMKYILISIVFIHFFGFVGFFWGLSYPLMWFFMPGKTICFFCLHTKLTNSHSMCPLCKREAISIYDPPLKSVIPNMITILFFAILSFAVVYGEFYFFTNTHLALHNSKTPRFTIPEKNVYFMGEEFYIDIEIQNIPIPINLVKTDIKYDHKLMHITRISTDESFATIFAQKEYSNDLGLARVVGGLPYPGFLGDKAIFIRIYFQPLKPGIANLQVLPTSILLASDGKGTKLDYIFDSPALTIQNR